jgi:Holliday junction DNA helicase RuvA
MIEYLSGILSDKKPGYSIVDINGMGYKVTCSTNCYDLLPKIKSPITFLIYFHINDNSQELYGFINEEERSLFKMLIGVSGIGPKTAINMLSTVPPNEFKNRLIAGEVKMLTSLPGIGPKTARRIIVELKDEFGKFDKDVLPIEDSSLDNDAYSALKNLGFSPKLIRDAIKDVLAKEGDLDTESIIKKTLQLLR